MKTWALGMCALALAMASVGCSEEGVHPLDTTDGAVESGMPFDGSLSEASLDGGVDARQDASGAPDGVGDSAAQDAGDSGFQEAPHAPYPQIPNSGGPTVAAPKLVTITFSGYAYTSTSSSFADWIVTSHWLSVVGSDYGIGPGTHVTNVVLPGPVAAQMTDLDTQALLEQNLANGTLPSAEGADAGTAADAGAAPRRGFWPGRASGPSRQTPRFESKRRPQSRSRGSPVTIREPCRAP